MAHIRVLVVDDEEDMRALVRATIELAGSDVSVEEAGSGADAIARLQRERPEVIVLDHRMPGFTGLETARRILAEHPEQHVLLFTAYPDKRIKAEADAAGVRATLSKNDLRRLPAIIDCLAAGGHGGGA
jgi:CheY-like chemotaxis protein